jgi:HSP20 family protein
MTNKSFEKDFVEPVSSLIHDVFDFFDLKDSTFLHPFPKSFPKMDIVIFDDHSELTAIVAGYDKSDIQVSIKDRVLTISGNKSYQDGINGDTEKLRPIKAMVLNEIKRSAFSRSFKLSPKHGSSIEAKINDGVLTVTINHIAETEPMNIPVN